MPTVLSNGALAGAYDYRLVALSVLIAMLASYVALDLGARVTAARGRAQRVWLVGGAAVMGLGIWAMHYIGMLAWSLPVPVLYDWPTVLVSLLIAVLASGVALYVVSRDEIRPLRTAIGGLVFGTGIAGMHYIGMEAMRLPAMCHYSPRLVTLSVIIAMLISLVALWLTFNFRNETRAIGWRKVASAALMGAAIPTMHYTGMAAVTFTPMAMAGSLTHSVAITSLGTVVIGSVTLMILGLTDLSSRIDRRFGAQAFELERLMEALTAQNERLEETVASRTRELGDANQRLTILDSAKDDFLRIISHELRTPLNGLLGVADIVLDQSSPPEDWDELRGMFEQSRQRMVSLLDDALLLTQIDVNGDQIGSAPVSLKAALDRALEQISWFAGLRRVTFQPVGADLGLVRGKEELLVRGFHALLETAVRFSEKGGTVRLGRQVAANKLWVTLESQGRTIPEAALAKFFDVFSICEAISPGEDLGLSAPLAFRVFSLFGNAVTVANREPSGIRLTVEFERIAVESVTKDSAPEESRSNRGAHERLPV
jgi:NO-binding membrane sensor protein with MHYT domain